MASPRYAYAATLPCRVRHMIALYAAFFIAVAAVYLGRTAVDRWVGTQFDRLWAVDTNAIVPEITAAWYEAWWTDTAVPVLRVSLGAAYIVYCRV